jgi:hypothetical protein
MSDQGPTGPIGPWFFPTPATGTVEPPHIATIEELMASHASTVNKETADRTLLTVLTNPAPSDFRSELFQWAACGFPAIYIVKTFAITPPTVCSDGVVRSSYEYVEYLLGVSHADFLNTLTSRVTGMTFSYSYDANSLRIHITKN